MRVQVVCPSTTFNEALMEDSGQTESPAGSQLGCGTPGLACNQTSGAAGPLSRESFVANAILAIALLFQWISREGY